MGGYNFDKDLFRKRVRELVKLDSKVSIEDANPVQIYKALRVRSRSSIPGSIPERRRRSRM